jgi:hypothetical protein
MTFPPVRKLANEKVSGTKKVKYLEENMAALDINLSPGEVMAIRTEIEKVEVIGERYPPTFEGYSFGDTPPL